MELPSVTSHKGYARVDPETERCLDLEEPGSQESNGANAEATPESWAVCPKCQSEVDFPSHARRVECPACEAIFPVGPDAADDDDDEMGALLPGHLERRGPSVEHCWAGWRRRVRHLVPAALVVAALIAGARHEERNGGEAGGA